MLRMESSELTPFAMAGDEPGYWIRGTNERVSIHFVDEPNGGRVTHLGLMEIRFVPDCGGTLFERRRVRLVLEHEGELIGGLSGDLEHCHSSEEPRALVRLGGVPLDVGRRLLALGNRLVERGTAAAESPSRPAVETIADEPRIRAVLGALEAADARGFLRAGEWMLPVKLVEVGAHGLELRFRADAPTDGAARDGDCLLELAGGHSLYRLPIRCTYHRDAGVLSAPLPCHMQRLRYRFYRRVPPPAPLRARYVHPLWPTLEPRECEVVELAARGLALAFDPDEDMLFPGLDLPFVELLDEGVVIRLHAQVRYLRPAGAGAAHGRWLCGLVVTPDSGEDQRRWLQLTARALHPRTCTSERHVESLWRLFNESGYFSLAARKPEQFRALERGFTDVGERTVRAPHLICQAVWPSERGAEATISCIKAYQHAWMGHQLAKRPGRSPAADASVILRDVYCRCFEHPQHDPDFRWMVSYLETTVPWIARAHLDFAERYRETGLVLSLPLRMLNVQCDEPSGRPIPRGLTLGPASDDELALLCHAVQHARPASYVDAFDFVVGRVELGAVTRLWRRFGLERERAVLVARDGERPLAAAVLELGHLGTNLFCLLDSVRLFALAGDGRAAFVALLDEARRWFAARGRRAFLHLCEDDGGDYAGAARLREPSEDCRPYLWILSAALIPDFLEHISELSDERRVRRGSRKEAQ